MPLQQGKGRLIVFEGIDGSGKTTQARLLAARMRKAELPVYETREPTERPAGRLLREVLMGMHRMDDGTLAMLFAADRMDHLMNEENGMLAKLESGAHVVCDRYYLSSYAYQSVNLPLDWVVSLNAQSAALVRPVCHVFIDVSPKVALARLSQSREQMELFENIERLAATRAQFFDVFDRMRNEENIVVINGEQSAEAVEADVWRAVQKYL